MDRKIRLLIVDDEIQFLDSIAERLELREFDVTKATRGAEALELAAGGGFDLALLDLRMPGMDGREVLETLKREHRHIEVIMLTGHGSVESAVECTKLGAFGYLPKPYELDDLLKVLQEAYTVRLRKKFERDEARHERIAELAMGSSPLAILRALRELDDEEK